MRSNGKPLHSKALTICGAILLATSGFYAPMASARELSVAIKGTNLHAWTTGAECRGYYGASTCADYFGDSCSSYGKQIWTTKSSFDVIYRAVIDQGQTADFIELNDGSDGKIVGNFGDTVCSLYKN